MDSGGRFTERTNDLTLGIARAQRDQSCVYTLGFYDEPELDRPRGVTIRVRRPGMRVLHASAYLFRSPAAKRQARISAAFVLPSRFDTGVIRAHLFPLRPLDKKSWEGLLVTSFPVPLVEGSEQGAVRDFGAVLTRKPSFANSFNRRVTLRPKSKGAPPNPMVTFVERVVLAPGTYELTAVMSDPEAGDPHSTRVRFELPPVPREELTVANPVLGRAAGKDVVIRPETAAPERGRKGRQAVEIADDVRSGSAFVPLLVARLDQPENLTAWTSVCIVGKAGVPESQILRSLDDSSGNARGSLPAMPLALEAIDGRGRVRCQNLIDLLPAEALGEGDYSFDAVIEPILAGEEHAIRSGARFAVGPPAPQAD